MQDDLRVPPLFEFYTFPLYCGAVDEFVDVNG
jgi:hypothetical protein